MPMPNLPEPVIFLTDSERDQIGEILTRRANEIATFKGDLERKVEQRLGDSCLGGRTLSASWRSRFISRDRASSTLPGKRKIANG